MSTVKIDVRGSHVVALPPERAVVHVGVGLDGRYADAVLESVTQSVEQVQRSLAALEGEAVSSYSVDQVRTSANRPWSQDGTQLPLVHAARVNLETTFVDVAALGRWAYETSQTDGITIEWIDWQLSDARRAEAEREARQNALRNARTVAQDYADALELGPIAVTRIRSTDAAGPQPFMPMAMKGMEAGDAGAQGADLLKPKDIEIRAEVDARFVVEA